MTLEKKQVITRFAPSPTGYLHIGGARTALFNYLFAKANGGKFMLRIEDTDRERSTDDAVEAILDGLQWLGIKHDGSPIMQFARAKRHREVTTHMLEAGTAYECYVRADELAEWREANPHAKYRSPYRDGKLPPRPNTPPTIRLKAPTQGAVVINDKVQGKVSVNAEELDDMILLRSDGTPTYMLAVVVDDHDMGITHVIRGDDHLTNAFRQKLLYEAMSWKCPIFAHIPLIHGTDGKKLSKRHGALGVEEYREMGYLPETMRNYLLRLGWSHGDDEIISDEQAIEWFNLENVGKAPARLDFDKMADLNSYYIKNADDSRLINMMGELELISGDSALLKKAMPVLKERSNTLLALAADAKWLRNSGAMDGKAKEMYDKADKAILAETIAAIAGVQDWSKESIEAALQAFMADKGYKLGQVGPALRALLTGTMQSPAIFDVMAALGKDEVLQRLNVIA